MKIKVVRYSDDGDSTLGVLLIDGKLSAYTLEDEKRTVKKFGETRIPEGTYKIGLRKVGGFDDRYTRRFPEVHEGMLHILDVPNFEYILIHIGNTEADTAGCLLVADAPSAVSARKQSISSSTGTYLEVYTTILAAIKNGEEVTIEYVDAQA